MKSSIPFLAAILFVCGYLFPTTSIPQAIGDDQISPIRTPWADDIDPNDPWPEYPRPQLVREAWQNLNGKWDWALTAADSRRPEEWSGKIIVPFSFESEASGVNRAVGKDQWMWYRRTFSVPEEWTGQRIWLRFEASDWETVVYVNGVEVGQHQEGYTPFAFDITDALSGDADEQEIVVRVWDHHGIDAFVSAGKQTQGRNYERSSGIWQTVWLEPLPSVAIGHLSIRGSYVKATVNVAAEFTEEAPAGSTLHVDVLDGETVVASGVGPSGKPLKLLIPDAKPWEPNSPHLYDLKVELLGPSGDKLDSIASYYGLRDISIDKSRTGPQIVLNGKAFFHFGPLDQGYWPRTGLTPPTDEAQLYELKYLKDAGCNMVRLHIKKNPARWYWRCDKLGLLVWQDFICNKAGKKLKSDSEETARWRQEQLELIDSLRHFPSIVKWIVFNEAWGQHNTEEVFAWAESRLPGYIVSVASGWDDAQDIGDIRDIHDYERFPSFTVPESEPQRVVVLGETGGFGIPINGNNWEKMPEPRTPDTPEGLVIGKDRQGGMKPVTAAADLDFVSDLKRPVYSTRAAPEHYERYVESLWLGQSFNLSGAVYTQLTDMRHEQNGWLTFDRKVSKIPLDSMRRIHDKLYQSLPRRRDLVDQEVSWFAEDGSTFSAPLSFSKGASRTDYTTSLLVESPVTRAALNIAMESPSPRVQAFGFLRVFIDDQLIFDDKARFRKEEVRMSSIPLTDDQIALLTLGEHVLRIEVRPSFSIQQLQVWLDAIE